MAVSRWNCERERNPDTQTHSWGWTVDRRQLFKGALAGTLSLFAAPILRAAQQGAPVAVRKLTDRIALIDVEGSNVVAFSADGVVLVDTGAPKTVDALIAALMVSLRTERCRQFSIRTTISITPAITRRLPQPAPRSSRTTVRVNGWRTITGCLTRIVTRRRGQRPHGLPNRSSIRDP